MPGWGCVPVDRYSEEQLAKIRELYGQVPDIQCKGLCWRQCSEIEMTKVERDHIREKYGITIPGRRGLNSTSGFKGCPALDRTTNRCTIYADRPLICRLWGGWEGMECRHGCLPDGYVIGIVEGMRLVFRADLLGGYDIYYGNRPLTKNQLRSNLKLLDMPEGREIAMQIAKHMREYVRGEEIYRQAEASASRVNDHLKKD